MFHDFPYTNFHELNLDFLMRQCGAGLGLRLAIEGDYLRLVNTKNEVVSQIKVHYSDTALSDTNGKPIKTYICDAQASGTALIFVNGQNEVTTITVPYAEKAKYDINSHEIEDYVYNVQVAGDKLRVTKGDQTIADITVPYAVQATEDEDGKTISTYAAELSVDGNNVVLRDAKGRVLESITVPYATEAYHADSADMAAEAAHAEEADSALDADHADIADLATVATDCTNAIQSVSISGNNVVFTTYAGQVTNLTIPYATKAQKDDAGNTIKTTYVASVSQNASTGEISFFDATGNVITSLVPTASKATYDNYDNEIADYIKNIVVSSNSDYVTVTHGDGAVDTIQINYSTHALKDTNENVIKNTYCRLLTMETDSQTGDPVLVGWNGDNPTAEIFRLSVNSKSCAGRIIFTTYTPVEPYRWPTGSIVVKATDEKGNTLTSSAEIKAKIESGAAIQVIATAFGSLGRGSYVPNKIQLIYDYDQQTPATTIGGLSVFFISNDNYVDFREGRKLFINLRQTNVTGEVYMELGKKIDDLSNVTITTPTQDQVLTYNGNTNKWENRSVGGDFFIDLTDGQEMFNFTQAEWTCTSFEVDDLKAAIADGKRIVIRAKNYLWGGDNQTPDKMYFVCSQAIDSNTGSQVVLAFTDGSRRYNALVAYTGTISSLNVFCALIQVDTSWI